MNTTHSKTVKAAHNAVYINSKGNSGNKIHPRTVEGIRISILEKLQVKSVVGVVLYAVKNEIGQ